MVRTARARPPLKICGVCGYGHVGETAGDERCRYCDARLDGPPSTSATCSGSRTSRPGVSTGSPRTRRSGSGSATSCSLPSASARPLTAASTSPRPTSSRAMMGASPLREPSTHRRPPSGGSTSAGTGARTQTSTVFCSTWSAATGRNRSKRSRRGRTGRRTRALASRYQRVVPFVEDRRNALLLTLEEDADESTLPSLQYALKRGIETCFQLEDNELAVELLPSRDHPSEHPRLRVVRGRRRRPLPSGPRAGGAIAVAGAALEACHFDPATGEDRRRAPGGARGLRGGLLQLPARLRQPAGAPPPRPAGGQAPAPTTRRCDRAARKPSMRAGRICATSCWRAPAPSWSADSVRFLDGGGYRLPDRAQPLLADYGTRPDFFYDDGQVCLYVDGPFHEFPERQCATPRSTARLEDGGCRGRPGQG